MMQRHSCCGSLVSKGVRQRRGDSMPELKAEFDFGLVRTA
jgi:hypothetical protein